MSIAAVIPLKRLDEAKGRIAGRVTPDERRHLVLEMLATVLAALGEVEQITTIVVVTSDDRVADLALRAGAEVVDDPGGGLNPAAGAGRDYARGRGFDYVLLLHGDLPLLQSTEIRDMVALAAPDVAVLAPDRREQGTNGLLVPAGARFELGFGLDSYRRHIRRVREAGLIPRTFQSPGTAFDLDTVDDFDDFQRSVAGIGE